MPKTTLGVRHYMTNVVQTIRPQEPLEVARDLMMRNACHHLPVVDHGKLVGIISERDVGLAEQYYRGNAASIRVDYAMTADVFAVGVDTPLEVAVDHMIRTRHGSVVVTTQDSVVGIFTMLDACRALHDLLADDNASRRASA